MSEMVDEQPLASASAVGSGPLSRVFFFVGAAGLLTAMASDATAVIGRHLGIPFLGSIELVQASVVLATSSAMIVATLVGAHATVHVLLDRLPARARGVLEVFGSLAGLACFALLASGSAWLAKDLWAGGERTELLGIPILPLRLFWCAAAFIVCCLFGLRAARVGKRGGA
jgi:TRAP-type C4-dicarboxylate transport system permease small subunit